VALVLDTGVLYAALDADDEHHRSSAALITETRERLVIPAPILAEIDHWCRKRLSVDAFLGLLADVEHGAYAIVDLRPAEYRRAAELCDRYRDSDVGFVDASVLAVVERLGERKLATIDRRHFSLMRPAHVEALELLP
jgi:predicted nucleic acid-binding protein